MQITEAYPLLAWDHCTVTWVLHPGGEARYYLSLHDIIQVYDINTAQLRELGSCTTIVMGKPVTTALISDDVCIPTEKVGCLQVTSQLQEFRNHFSPESIEKAFEQIYQTLQVLDAYLIDNLQQHQYCMLPDNEYTSLITYTTELEIDLCNFLAIWAVSTLYPLRHQE